MRVTGPSHVRGLDVRRPPRRLAVALALAAACGLPGPASGQEVRLDGEPRSEAQEALRRFLDAEGFTLWVRDTVLARGDTVAGPVLLLEGRARIAGRIEGDLYVVDGDLFLRTGAVVAGDVLVLGGGFYDSDLAEVAGALTYRPNEPLRVRPTAGGFEIFSEVEPEPGFELDGLYGLHLPTYDRVNGLSFPVGGLVRLSKAPGRPELAAGVTWIPAREDVDFRLHNSWHVGERVRLGLFADRAVMSNEAWIRPTWYNGLAHFVAGDDVRDHYDAETFGVELEWVSPEPPVWEDAPAWQLVLSAERETTASLPDRDVTVLFGGERAKVVRHRRMDRIGEEPYWLARAGFAWSARGRRGRVGIGVGAEAGFPDRGEAVPGARDRESSAFLLLEGRLAARRVTAWGHAVDAFVIGRVDAAGRLPARRYSTLGGVGTLPTVRLRGLRGARMLYAEAAYAVPLVGDATLGGLDLFARGGAGGIGAPGVDFGLHASLAGGLAIRLWEVRLEFGAATGSTAGTGPDAPGVIAFVDVRTGKSARPTRMPPRR